MTLAEKLKAKPVAGIIGIVVALAALAVAVLAIDSSSETHPVFPAAEDSAFDATLWEKVAPRLVLTLGALAIFLAGMSYIREGTRRIAFSAGGIALLACGLNYAMITLAVLVVCIIVYAILQGL